MIKLKPSIFISFILFSTIFAPGIVRAQEISNELLPALVSLQTMADGGQASSLLNSLGAGAPGSTETLSASIKSSFSIPSIIACLLFGAIGFVAFAYGKKEGNFKALIIGMVLMGYPYFVTDPIWLYGIGGGLTLLLYLWRD